MTQSDKLEAALIFAGIFTEEVDVTQTPEEIVNFVINEYVTTPEIANQVSEMLVTLKEDFGIVADPVDHLSDQPNYSDHEQVDDTPIDFSSSGMEELDDISDEELDSMIDTYLKPDDYYEDYPEDQLCVVDDETGQPFQSDLDEGALNEVLSRMERMRSSIRFHRTEAKRARKLKIALTRKSDTKTITNRARRLAVKALEQRIARKPLSQLTVSEKERIEAKIAKAKPILNRLTVRLISRVKQLEQKRLHEGF